MCPPLPAARSALGAGLQARGRLGQGPGFPPRSGAGGRAGGWAGGRAGRRWAGELCAAWELLLQGSWGETGPRVGTAPVGGKSLPRLLQLSKCTGASSAWHAWLQVPEASSDHCPAAPPASTWHSLQDVPVSARLQPAPLQRVCLGAEPAGSSSSSYHSRSTQAGGRPPPACCGPAAPPLGYNML